MARDFFKNLPNTTTPLTAPRMNALLDGDEAMGNIVVDSIRSKNMLNINMFAKGRINTTTGNTEYPERVSTLTIGSNSVLITTTQSWSGIHTEEFIEVDENETYNLNFTTTNASSSWGGLVCYGSSFNYLGEATKTTISSSTNASYNFTLLANTKYVRVVLQNTTATTITYSNLQLEKGNSVSTYSEYQGIGYVSGNNDYGNYIKYDDGTLMQWGEATFGTSGTANDSYKLITLPVSFGNSNFYLFAQPHYVSSGVPSDYMYGTNLIPSKNSTHLYDFYVYRRLTYLKPTDSGQTALYSYPTPFYWIAIGRWK